MPFSITVTHRGTAYPLQLAPSTTLAHLHAHLEQLTSVPPSNQKLIYKGKKAGNDDTTLAGAGFKDGMKIQMLGSTAEEIGGIKAVEDEHAKRERIMRDRALKPQAKLRSTGPSALAPSSKYKFHRIAPLPHLQDPSSAQEVLNKLASDPAILHVMAKHEFSVGLLTELAPHEHPGLLGLNVNAGQEIKLRIRTNAYDGFRPYNDVRRVLCHELTHNVWGEHDDNFKELNSKLNREVTQFERSQAAGTHHLSDQYDTYQPPSSELEAEAQTYVLGGSSTTALIRDSREDMRRRMLEATMNRLRKEEEELELSCGTGSDLKTSSPDDPTGSSS